MIIKPRGSSPSWTTWLWTKVGEGGYRSLIGWQGLYAFNISISIHTHTYTTKNVSNADKELWWYQDWLMMKIFEMLSLTLKKIKTKNGQVKKIRSLYIWGERSRSGTREGKWVNLREKGEAVKPEDLSYTALNEKNPREKPTKCYKGRNNYIYIET